MNKKVDAYIARNEKWSAEIAEMRKIALSCPLTEDLKWGSPCYTLDGQNVVLIHVFKEYAAFLFFKGALMADKEKLLIQMTANVQSSRQLRFVDQKEVKAKAKVIKAYIMEAIAVEKSGAKVTLKKTEDFPVPEEFQQALKKNAALKKAFQALTPGRQRAYLFHFAQPKKSETRLARVEKNIPSILKGKGLND